MTVGRPIGKVDEAKLVAYLTETEQLFVKPALGDALFLDILKDGYGNPVYKTLLDGGVYSSSCDKTPRLIAGLKVAISYYVYAQNVMSGDFESTRYGMVIKNGEYSDRISSKERSDCYNNAMGVANEYMKQCVKYCKDKGLIKSAGKGYSNGGITIRKIG